MGNVYVDKMNPVVETFGLLYMGCHPEYLEETYYLNEIRNLGLEGEEVFKKAYVTLRKYVAAFTKYWKMSGEEKELFESMEDDFFQIILLALIENKSWIDTVETLQDQEVKQAIKLSIIHDAEDTAYFGDDMQFLESQDLSTGIKWKLLMLFQKPSETIRHYIYAIQANIVAYEKVCNDLKKILDKLLQNFSRQENKQLEGVIGGLAEEAVIVPTLVIPIGTIIQIQIDGIGHYYSGLYSEEYFRVTDNKKDMNSYFIPVLKALSDSSKFKILQTLKTSPKYNLEIAGELELTPATVSHHMSVLLGCGLVGVEKNGGKVYYHLKKDNVKGFLGELEHILL